MAFDEERMQILKMLEEGKISAEEAARLLAALNAGAEKERPASGPAATGRKKRRVRISVMDGPSGRQKEVNINLPIGVAKIVGKMKGKFPHFEGIDLDDIFEAFESNIEGEIIEVQDEEEGKRVRISIE